MHDPKSPVTNRGRLSPSKEEAIQEAKPVSVADLIPAKSDSISRGELSHVLMKYVNNDSGSMRDPLKALKLVEASLKDLLGIDISEELFEDVDSSEIVGQGGPVPEGDKDLASQHIDKAIATTPKDAGYGVLAAGLEQETRTLRQSVAARLLPALKDEMRGKPHGTYDQKVELVRWVNAELDRFGLAFRNPKTGGAATFRPIAGNHPEIGAFRLEGRDAEGQVKTFNTPDLETLLDKLELMDVPARREPLAEWQATVGRQRRGAKRG